MRTSIALLLLLLTLVTPAVPRFAQAARVKDLVRVKGYQDNLLEGMGLVVGLAGSGDSIRSVTTQAFQSYLRKRGLNVAQNDLRMRNVAFVTVVGKLPPFATRGARIDVSVMASGDARSLRGGTLLMAPLRAIDGEVYAVAQGNLTVGGFSAAAGSLATLRRNTPTAGRIPGGAIVEKEVKAKFLKGDEIVLALHEADFTTAFRIIKAINEGLKAQIAFTDNPGAVSLKLPDRYLRNPVEFISIIEAFEVEADTRARVVVNERTGTVVVGGKVTLNPAAVAHGDLTVAVKTELRASQPTPFSRGGTTAVVPNGSAAAQQGRGKVQSLPATTTVEELVAALNALGASPQDLVSILQALDAAGAINGELETQ